MMKLNDQIINKVFELYAAHIPQREIARITGLTKGVVQAVIEKRHYPKEFQVINLGSPIEVIGDAMIVGDVHVPATDWDFACLVARVAEHRQVGQLIIAGDFFNMDWYSRFPHISNVPTWAMERDAGKRLLDDWLITFDRIYILMGNHERLIQKANAGAFEGADIFSTLTTSSKVTVSNFGYCSLTSGGQTWRVSHGREYSINPLTVGNELAQKNQCNVISHHQHHLGVTMDRYNRYVVVDNGSLVDPVKLAYVIMDENKKPNMKNGFTCIVNGVPSLYGRYPFTDWSFIAC
jgi:hypothetical protein